MRDAYGALCEIVALPEFELEREETERGRESHIGEHIANALMAARIAKAEILARAEGWANP